MSKPKKKQKIVLSDDLFPLRKHVYETDNFFRVYCDDAPTRFEVLANILRVANQIIENKYLYERK